MSPPDQHNHMYYKLHIQEYSPACGLIGRKVNSQVKMASLPGITNGAVSGKRTNRILVISIFH